MQPSIEIKRFMTDEEASQFKTDFKNALGFLPLIAIENGYYVILLDDDEAYQKYCEAVKDGRLY